MFKIAGAVLLSYLRTFGLGTVIVVIMAYTCQLAADVGGNIWLSEWSLDMDRLTANETLDESLIDLRVGVYGGIGLAQSKWS